MIRVPILLYHQIIEKNSESFDRFCVSIDTFKVQMQKLYSNGYQAITLENLVDSGGNSISLPEKPFIITFDDGHRDNYLNAFPILKSFNFSALIFLVANYIGAIHENGKYRYLSLNEIQEMQEYGIVFQSHGYSHASLTELNLNDLQTELLESKTKLEKVLGHEVKFFAYPYGKYNDTVKKQTEQAEYLGACGGLMNLDGSINDLYEIGRVEIFETDSLITFMHKVRTGYNMLEFTKRKIRWLIKEILNNQ